MVTQLKYITSRIVGTGVDTLVLWVMSHFVFSGNYFGTFILSPVISFEVAVMSNFLFSYYWIWHHRVSIRNKRSFWRHFVGFNISSLAGFLVKMLFLILFERWFGFGVIICNLLALLVSGGFNFLLFDLLVFRKKTARPEHELLSIKELKSMSPFFRGRFGTLFARFAMWFCGMDRLNRLYDHISDTEGPVAASKALDYIGCDYLIGNPERLTELPQGAFITISNHPYGGLDGVILLDMLGHQRENTKIMVNKLLGRIKPLKDNFITVTPTGTKKKDADATTLGGLRACLSHLHSGEPLCLFPSGAVSDLHIWRGDISDREWQDGIIKFIARARVPIVPIHFEGRNSLFYYSLGLIDWRVRLLRLPREVLNKHKGVHRVVIGETISVGEQTHLTSIQQLKELLRRSVYEMPSPTRHELASKLKHS